MISRLFIEDHSRRCFADSTGGLFPGAGGRLVTRLSAHPFLVSLHDSLLIEAVPAWSGPHWPAILGALGSELSRNPDGIAAGFLLLVIRGACSIDLYGTGYMVQG